MVRKTITRWGIAPELKNRRKFIIVDFGASLVHTHHKKSLWAFSELLNSCSVHHEIWVPMGSQIHAKHHNMKKILLPGTHPVAFDWSQISTWIPSAIGWLHNRAANRQNEKLLNLILNFIALFFVVQLTLRKQFRSELLFTTFCPFSYKAIRILDKLNLKIYLRLTNTTERRGYLSTKININKLNRKNIRIGYETEAFKEILIERGLRNIFESKFPTQIQSSKTPNSALSLTVSFLGYPTKHKGKDHILNIIKQTSLKRPDLNWIVQLGEKDPLYDELVSLKVNIRLEQGKISSELMIDLLDSTSILCLPYDNNSYKLNSSAMMYEAADHLVPVITYSGSAFAYDVQRFKCGLTPINESVLIQNLVDLNPKSISDFKYGCNDFNESRINSNLIFLNLAYDR